MYAGSGHQIIGLFRLEHLAIQLFKADADAGGAHLGSAAKGKGSDFLHPFHGRLSFF